MVNTIVFIRHVDSDLWISYETLELTIKGIGKVEEKRVKKYLGFYCKYFFV